LWGRLALNRFLNFESELASATSSVLDNLDKLFMRPPLIPYMLRFFGNIFRCFPDYNYQPSDLKKLATFCLGILRNSCSADSKPQEDPMLITTCCDLFSVAPTALLQYNVIEVLATLYHHLKYTKTGFLHPLILYATFHCSNVPVDKNVQGQLTHFIRGIMRTFFETRDWATHYGTIWHLGKILASGSDSKALESILSNDVKKVLFEDFHRKKAEETRIFFTPGKPESVKLLIFFQKWLALHPPNSFFISDKNERNTPDSFPPLNVAIEAIQNALDQPYVLGPLDKQKLKNLGALLSDLE